MVEIGVVLIGSDGGIKGEFTTLVDPAREIGAGDIHGITASDLTLAPSFVDVTPYLRSPLSDRMAAQHSRQIDGRLARLVRNLPPGTSHLSSEEAVTDYLGLLNQVLLDRYVTVAEAELLASAIRDLGLSSESVAGAHRKYLVNLAHAALGDGIVTESERADLNSRSGKASKAAADGIPVVAEQVFLYSVERLGRLRRASIVRVWQIGPSTRASGRPSRPCATRSTRRPRRTWPSCDCSPRG